MILHETPWSGAGPWTYLFGVLWGFGGLTFGLTMRYLGISLGMAIALELLLVFRNDGPAPFCTATFVHEDCSETNSGPR